MERERDPGKGANITSVLSTGFGEPIIPRSYHQVLELGFGEPIIPRSYHQVLEPVNFASHPASQPASQPASMRLRSYFWRPLEREAKTGLYSTHCGRSAREVSQTIGRVEIKERIFFIRLLVAFSCGSPAERTHILHGFATRLQREAQ
jgi:hypothetical protein